MNASSTLLFLSVAAVLPFLVLGLTGRRTTARPRAAAVPTLRRSIAVKGSRTLVLNFRIELEVEEEGSTPSPRTIRVQPVTTLPDTAAPKPTHRPCGRFRSLLAWARRLAPATLARGTAKVPGLCLRLAAGLW